MSRSVDSETSKHANALISRATDRAQGGDGPAILFTGEALLRLKEGLRAHLEEEGQRFPDSDVVASSSAASSVAWQDWTTVSGQPISENPPLAPGADLPITRAEESVRSRSGLTTDHAHSKGGPAVFTEIAVLRLKEGLRAQREEEGRRFTESDVASSSAGSSRAWQDWTAWGEIKPISETPPLAPDADQPLAHTEEPGRSPSGRRRIMGLLICALFLVAGAVALGVSLKARTAGSTDAVTSDIEAHRGATSVLPNEDDARQPLADAVKSSAHSSAVAVPSKAPVEQSAETAAAPASATPAPPNDKPVEAQRAAAPASATPAPPIEQPVQAQAPAAPAASRTVHRHKPWHRRHSRR